MKGGVWPKLSTVGKDNYASVSWHRMLQVVGDPKRDRSRHQAPARRARGRSCARRAAHLARRRVAHHHPLGARRRLLVGGRAAPSARCAGAGPCARSRRRGARASPARSTCRAPAPTGRSPASSPPTRTARSTSPIPAAWAAQAGNRASASSWPTACGARVQWPDGEETEALIVAPLDSPRLTRLLGRFVDSVRRFKEGETPASQPTLCVEPSAHASAAAACDRSLVDAGAARGARQARPVRRRRRSLLAARRAPAAAVCPDRRRPAGGAGAGRRLAVAGRGARRRRRATDPDRAGRTCRARGRARARCPSPASATAGAARGPYSTASTTRWRDDAMSLPTSCLRRRAQRRLEG